MIEVANLCPRQFSHVADLGKGEGATRNGEPIQTSSKSDLTTAVVGTAVPPLAQVGTAGQDEALGLLRTVSRSVFMVRPKVAGSLQLAYVAAENGHDAADRLAGTLLIREAGGIVTTSAARPSDGAGDGIVARNAPLQRALLSTIGAAGRPAIQIVGGGDTAPTRSTAASEWWLVIWRSALRPPGRPGHSRLSTSIEDL